MATPAQKAILMGLAQLREVEESTFHTRAGPAFRMMLKRWEGYTKKLARDTAHVSVPPRAHTLLKTLLTKEVVVSMDACIEDVLSQTVSSAHSHVTHQDDTLSTLSVKVLVGKRKDEGPTPTDTMIGYTKDDS